MRSTNNITSDRFNELRELGDLPGCDDSGGHYLPFEWVKEHIRKCFEPGIVLRKFFKSTVLFGHHLYKKKVFK